MTAQCGSAIVVSFKNGAGVYQVVAGGRTQRIAFGAEMVDVTNASSVGKFRELLAGCGIRSCSISAEGIFQDDAGMNAVSDAHFNNEHREAKIFIPGFGTVEGVFQVSQLEIGGEYNQGVPFSSTFESAGEYTFTGV